MFRIVLPWLWPTAVNYAGSSVSSLCILHPMPRCNLHLGFSPLLARCSCLPFQNCCKCMFGQSLAVFGLRSLSVYKDAMQANMLIIPHRFFVVDLWTVIEKRHSVSLGLCENLHRIQSLAFTVVSCGMPIAPVNGSVIGQHFTLSSRVTFSCNPGFRLANAQPVSTVCQESGRWTPMETRPRCVRKLKRPTKV